jgi:hypothetical protein
LSRFTHALSSLVLVRGAKFGNLGAGASGGHGTLVVWVLDDLIQFFNRRRCVVEMILAVERGSSHLAFNNTVIQRSKFDSFFEVGKLVICLGALLAHGPFVCWRSGGFLLSRERMRAVVVFDLGILRACLTVIPTVNTGFDLLNFVFVLCFNVLEVDDTVTSTAHVPDVTAVFLGLAILSEWVI